MAWPTGSDLESFLANHGVTMPDGSAIPPSVASDALVLSAVETFEQLTGWIPFEGVTETRYFDPPGSDFATGRTLGGGISLPLRAGLLSVSSLTVSGTSRTENTDFFLKRSSPEMPAFAIVFRTRVFGLGRSVAVTGLWGRMVEATELAKLTVLQLAAYKAVTVLLEGIRGQTIEWKEADVSERKSIELLGNQGAGFKALANETISSIYKRVSVG